MTEMIAAEPAFAERCLIRLVGAGPDGPAGRLAAALREAAAAGAPVTVVGCGTSEHGALGLAEIVRDAWGRAELPGSRTDHRPGVRGVTRAEGGAVHRGQP